jgi:hypothetical protein
MKTYDKSKTKEEKIPSIKDMERDDSTESDAPEGEEEGGEHYEQIQELINQCDDVNKLDEIQTMIDTKRAELEGVELEGE